jgi:hypothetical protein
MYNFYDKYDACLAYLNRKSELLLSYFYDKEQYKRIFFCLIILAMLVVMYLLNKHTTLIVDDYGYSYSMGKRTQSVYDIILNQYRHYFHWGGRSVVHFLAQYFLMFEKSLFNVANTLAYVAMVLAIYFHMLGKRKLVPSLLVIINFVFWAFMPMFGQVFLWVDGACNYLWGPLLVFAYLLPFRFQLEQEDNICAHKALAVLFGFLGIIAGWTNENLGVTIVWFIMLFILSMYLLRGKVYFWSVCAAIGTTIGATLLIAAPGNYVRYGLIHNVSYVRNFVNVTKLFFDSNYLLLPVIALFVAFILCKRALKKEVVLLYLSSFLISMYAMVGAPYYADRAKLGSLCFCLALFGYCYEHIEFNASSRRKVQAVLMLGMVIVGLKYLKDANRDIRSYEQRDRAKIALVMREKAKGNLHVVIPRNYPKTRFAASYGLEDINKDPKHWTNTGFARYFGLKSVRVQ